MKMKLLIFLITLIVVGTFSVISLDSEKFKTCAAWILIPMIVGYLLKRTGIPDITEIGWGIHYGALSVSIVLMIVLIYLIATWKMTKLF
jgi:hypothetical protein